MVSVVITCYNQARFLGEAIESVLAQSYPRFEIIVVDDESPDNTSEVAADYAEKIQYIRQNNQGVAVARNNGFRASRGDYVMFLDGDDRLLPAALETGLQNLEARKDCAFVFGYCQFIDINGAPLPTLEHRYIEREHYLELLRDCYIWMPAVVIYRRDILASVGGFDTAVDHACDYDLYLRLTRQFPVHCHNKIVAEWRLHGGGVHHHSARMLKAALKVYRAQWNFVKANKQYAEAFRKGLRFWQEFYGEQVVENVRAQVRIEGGWKPAVKDSLVLLRHCPHLLARHAGRKVRCVVFGVKL